MQNAFGVTGGAGFIGTNLCQKLILASHPVVIFDDLSRVGAEKNLRWLCEKYPKQVHFIRGNIAKDKEKLKEFVEHSDVIFHLAGQVAVTKSLADPKHDFAVNVHGTFNLLEAIRHSDKKPGLIYTSTNKVYGDLVDLQVSENRYRFELVNSPLGVTEKQPLDFSSPYGCSKGAADQYVRDYARSYGLSTVVLRQSCIYGPRQFGVEDQGWLAWFVIAAITGQPITIYGNGKQVRDVLFIEDLTELFLALARNIERFSGETFNVGGGPENTISLLEFIEALEDILGKKIPYGFADARVGDQPIYISDIRKVTSMTGWSPKNTVKCGVTGVIQWVKENENLFLEHQAAQHS